MGKRTENALRFITKTVVGTGGKNAVQFIANTGRSAYAGIKKGLEDVEGIELYESEKPHHTA
jgi:hypothetical protein